MPSQPLDCGEQPGALPCFFRLLLLCRTVLRGSPLLMLAPDFPALVPLLHQGIMACLENFDGPFGVDAVLHDHGAKPDPDGVQRHQIVVELELFQAVAPLRPFPLVKAEALLIGHLPAFFRGVLLPVAGIAAGEQRHRQEDSHAAQDMPRLFHMLHSLPVSMLHLPAHRGIFHRQTRSQA